MGIFGGSQQTAQITTGNVRTTYDLWQPGPTGLASGALTINNNLKNPLGLVYYDVGGSASFGETPVNPVGSPVVYKYLLYKSATNPALVAAPAVVFYTDETFTTVSGAVADGVTQTSVDIAGLMMPNTTDLPNLTAAILNNGGNGSGVWVCVGGVVKGAYIGAATVAKGDFITAISGSQFTITDITNHSGTLTPDKILAYALTAGAANKADMIVQPLAVA